MTASRVQRWSVFLSGYQYIIKYIKGSLIGNADCLSHLNSCSKIESDDVESDGYSYLSYVEDKVELISRDSIKCN